jgi:heparanase
MGTTVLDTGLQNRDGLHVYGHCLRGVPGGVAILVLNTSPTETTTLSMPVPANRSTLTASTLTAASVMLNGRALALGTNDQLPVLDGQATAIGPLDFAAASITFLALPAAGNSACR